MPNKRDCTYRDQAHRREPSFDVRATHTPTLQLEGKRTSRTEHAQTVRQTVQFDTEPTVARGSRNDTTLVLDRYQLRRRLGSGAFGTVWSAHDERLERDVAVKILPRERVNQARFEREARAGARLQHPAIVTLYEAAVDDDGAYLVSELVRGSTLDQVLASGRLSDRDVVEIALGLCDALEYAHQEGVIHRDVKPSNVLVPKTATTGRHPIKLTDFGVAKISGEGTLTKAGEVIGTLVYMAPEQAAGLQAGPEADLFSVALITYEALSGVNPQANHRPGRQRRLASYLPPLRRQRHDLPRDLAAAIDTALRPQPHERGTLADLAGALSNSLAALGDQPGVIEPARAATLIAPLRRGHDDDREFDETWRDDRRADGARRAKDNAPVRSDRGVIRRLRQRFGWRSTTLLSAVVLLGLGAVGAAGAWPALAAVALRSWWQRLLAGALGFAWLGVAGQIVHRSMYWQIPTHHLAWGAVAAGVWALATVLAGWIRRFPSPGMALIATAGWAAATPAAVIAAGVHPLTREVLGAALGGVFLAMTVITARRYGDSSVA